MEKGAEFTDKFFRFLSCFHKDFANEDCQVHCEKKLKKFSSDFRQG